MPNSTLTLRFLLLGTLGLAACAPETNERDGEVSAEDLAATAIENVERALRGTLRAGSFLADSQSVADSLGALGADSESCDETAPCTPDGCPEPVCEVDQLTVEDLQAARSDLDEAISELVADLRDEVFSDANLESEDDDSVTFLLGPNTLCEAESPGLSTSPTPGEPPPPAPPPQMDPECVDAALRMQPRLRLSSAGENDVDVDVLLTAERRNLVTLELHHDRAAVVADLGQVKGTLDAAGVETEGLVSMAGKFSFEIRRNAELDYSVSTNVLEDIDVVTVDDTERIHVTLGASSPSGELRFNGNARTITGRTDLGRFSLSGPLNAFRSMFDSQEYDDLGNPLPQQTYVGDIEVVVPGLEGSVTYDGASDKVSLAGFGLGDASSTLKFNGIPLAALDLNAALGRHFDVGIENTAAGAALFTLTPGFDLSVLLNFMPVADQISDLPSYLLNDTIRVWFDGTNPSVEVNADQFRVVSGTLNASSAANPDATVSVPAGMCVVEADVASSTHELLGEFAAGVCGG